MLELTRKMTLGQITAREDFAKRIAAEKPVYLHECLYPLMQGWDSVEIRADVELGGTEQLFSLLVARDLQQGQGQEPQVALDDADPGGDRRGAADGKEPGELHRRGRIGRESVRQDHEHSRRADEAVFHAARPRFRSRRSIGCWRRGSIPETPRKFSARRSWPSTTGDAAANAAAAQFRRRAAGEDPDEIPEVAIDAGKLDAEGRLPAFILVKELGLESSTSNARRVIEQGGVSISFDSQARAGDRPQAAGLRA